MPFSRGPISGPCAKSRPLLMAPGERKVKKPGQRTRTRTRTQIATNWGLAGPRPLGESWYLIHMLLASGRNPSTRESHAWVILVLVTGEGRNAKRVLEQALNHTASDKVRIQTQGRLTAHLPSPIPGCHPLIRSVGESKGTGPPHRCVPAPFADLSRALCKSCLGALHRGPGTSSLLGLVGVRGRREAPGSGSQC